MLAIPYLLAARPLVALASSPVPVETAMRAHLEDLSSRLVRVS